MVVFIKIFLAAIILCITMLNSIPQNTYAQEQPTVVKEFPYKFWITYGDTIKLEGSTVTNEFGIKDKKVKLEDGK